jgi:hypothetical protein
MVRADLRDTEGDWFYWCFRITGAAGRRLQILFTAGNPVGVRGPALSVDGGPWSWLGPGVLIPRGFHVDVPATAREVRLGMTIPYVQTDLEAFLARQPELTRGVLTRSRAGREVELLRLPAQGVLRQRVLLTARHHCCEAMASFVLEGLLTAAARDEALRAHTELVAVPLVDKDGVERGDQGKNRRPRDHNRDYDERPIYPEVRALKALAAGWTDAPVAVALDLHCPYISGTNNEHIYFVGGPEAAMWERVQAFARRLEALRRGPLPYAVKGSVPFGTSWNTAANYRGGQSCTRWATSLPGIRFASSLEIPYANASGAEVNPASARAFGADLAAALSAELT